MKKLLAAAAALFLGSVVVLPAAGQSTNPTTLDGVMLVCTGVIAEQYEGDHDRDGQCIAAVQSYLDAIGAQSAATDPLIADLVLALVELYELDPECKIADTELPEAISLAASKTFDAEVAAEYLDIYEQIDACDFEPTAAINDQPATSA